MHPSTTNQLLKTLVDSAHLQFNARAMTYLPSPRLLGFGRWIIEVYGADSWLRDLVREVSAETELVTTLTTPNDLFMQIIDWASPEGLHVERGQRVSIFGSATGSAYLSTLPRTEVERLADRARIVAGEIVRIMEALEDIRRDGFADGCNRIDATRPGEAMWSIAVPIPQGRLPFALVLGLAGPADHVQTERDALQRLLRAAATRASQAAIT